MLNPLKTKDTKPKSTEYYDVIIVGAGICGTSLAYFLHQAGQKVLIIEKDKVASGGSGAAGAFISPKFTRDPLQLDLSQKAYAFALDFFNTNFPELIQNRPLLHLASSDQDQQKIAFYKEYHTAIATPESLKKCLKLDALAFENVFIEDAAMVNAQEVCEALCKGVDIVYETLDKMRQVDGEWVYAKARAKHLVLATGAYKDVINEEYLEVQGVWGHRINVKTAFENFYNIHQKVSISPTQKEGYIAIGATHDREYHPQKNRQAYCVKAGRKTLLEKANFSVDLGEVDVLEDFTGLRASYYDHLPVVGPLINAKKTLENFPLLAKGTQVPSEQFCYYDNVSIINGVGGYGFSFAPYIASMLADAIIEGKAIEKIYQPLRLFKRWVKRVEK